MILMTSILSFALLSCSKPVTGTDDNTGEDKDKEDVLFPEAPEEVNQENLFHVDFLTDLADAPYMQDRSIDKIVSFIKSRTGKKPLVYMVDRMDFEVGKVHPSVLAGHDLSMNPFFAQCSATTENKIPGTAILTIYPISDYDGSVQGKDNFISGGTLKAPLQQPQDLTFYTSRFESLEQMKEITRIKSARLKKSGILTGTVRKEAAQAIKSDAAWKRWRKRMQITTFS